MLTVAVTLLACGCGVRSLEEQILDDFFAAARLHDTSALSRVATVDFNPRTMGVVHEYEIAAVEVSAAGTGGETRHVVLAAQLRRPEGEVVPTTLAATLERRDGTWLLTAIRIAGDRPPG